jgi:hypothetical protein
MAELPGPSASLVDSVPPGRPLISKLAGKRTRADIYLSTAAERERERERKREEGSSRNVKPLMRVARVTMLDLSAEEDE